MSPDCLNLQFATLTTASKNSNLLMSFLVCVCTFKLRYSISVRDAINYVSMIPVVVLASGILLLSQNIEKSSEPIHGQLDLHAI